MFVSTIPPVTAKSESGKSNVSRTYTFSESVLPRSVQFRVPFDWDFAGRTLPRRNLYRDGDVYDFTIHTTRTSGIEEEKISITLLTASGAQIVLFNKESRPHKQLVLNDGRRCILETVGFYGGTVGKNVWIKMDGRWIIVTIEADATVMKRNRKGVQAVIDSITLPQKQRSYIKKM